MYNVSCHAVPCLVILQQSSHGPCLALHFHVVSFHAYRRILTHSYVLTFVYHEETEQKGQDNKGKCRYR